MNYFALFLCCVTVFTGCASDPLPPLTIVAPDQRVAPPPPNKAQIIFIQPFKPLGGTAETALFKIEGSSREFLGLVSSKTKLVKLVEPGQHIFMAPGGFGPSFLLANVEAGKRYYVLSRFIAYAGYQLRPIRRHGPSNYNASIPEFQEWLREATLVTTTLEGAALVYQEPGWSRPDASKRLGGLAEKDLRTAS